MSADRNDGAAVDQPASPSARIGWIAAVVVIAAILFWLATNDAVYELTSPSSLSWHVWARKAYSIVAFALVGFTVDKALGPTTRPYVRAAVLVAGYSGAIEIVQALQGSHEGPIWNAIDVVCGAVGGWLGVFAGRIAASRRSA